MTFLKLLNYGRYSFDKLLFKLFGKPKNLQRMEGLWKGEGVIIVGNGPSLKETPLNEFSSFKSIGMNKINLIFDDTDWRPSIIVCSNRHVIYQNREFFSDTKIPLFIKWQNRIFLRAGKSINTKYFYESKKIYFSRLLHEGAGAGATVTFTALQLAYHLGADPVILVGVDHNFQADGVPHETQVREGEDPNHFHPDYFANGVKWNLPDLETSEIAYKLAYEEFKGANRRIFDATVGGKLDVFPKISINDAINILNEDR
jgi:hypothetical protein